VALALFMGFLAWPGEIQGQVGILSRAAQVGLVATAPVRASMPGVSRLREGHAIGSLRQGAVSVRLSSNGGFRLIVRGIGDANGARPHAGSRVWVRAVDGQFHEVKAGSAFIVARQDQQGGDYQPEVQYRIESSTSDREATRVLPVRYEVAVNPVL
jgi:hypothetical protein